MFTTKVVSSPVWDKVTPIMSKLPPHYPVLLAEELLKGKNCQQTLAQLKNLAFVPENIFNELYLKALHNYATFVQGLPATQVDAFNYHGGLLELGIKRALQTLAWYRKEFPIRHATPEQMPVRQAIWSYALFTAGLMYGIGQIIATYWVMMCKRNGHPEQRWNPVQGYMREQGEFYRYSFETTRRDELAARSTLVLALAILPSEGVSWIATDAEIFNSWLAILLNDEKHAGLFAKCILPIEADLEQQPNLEAGFLIGDLIQQFEIGESNEDKKITKQTDEVEYEQDNTTFNEEGTISPSNFTNNGMFIPGKDNTLSKITGVLASNEFGEAFLYWLKTYGQRYGRQYGNGALSQLLITSPQGLLIGRDSALLKAFSEQNPQAGSAEDIYNKLKNSPYVISEVHRQASSGLTGLAQQKASSQTYLALDPTAFTRKFVGSVNYDLPLARINAQVFPVIDAGQAQGVAATNRPSIRR